MSLSMKKSASMPTMRMTIPTMEPSKGHIHHRGSHAVGTLKGAQPGDGMPYVPRASWTEATESPMRLGNRQAEFDPQQFMKEEQDRLHGKERLRQYLLNQYAQQWGAGSNDAEQARKDYETEVAANTADVNKLAEDEKRKKKRDTENRRQMREGLDQQSHEMALRARDQRLQEAKEFNEMKLRSSQQLCLEMKEQERRRQMLKQNENEVREHMALNARNRQENRDEEIAMFRQMQREQTMQDVSRLMAQQNFLKEKQDQMQASSDVYERTAGAKNRSRENHEMKRQDDDEKRHNLRMDTFYARREQAREKQRQNMVKGLKEQCDHREAQRNAARNQRNDDGDAMFAAARRNAEMELQKQREKRQQELEVQQHHRDHIAEKARKEKEAGTSGPNYGFRPALSVSTMLPADAKSPDYSRRVDAARFVSKPLGRPEDWVSDPAEAEPLQPREANKAPPRKGVKDGYLHTCSNEELQERAHRMTAKWHEGLTKQDLKKGLTNARRREANHVGKYNS
eukprot:TRINITY_DN9742_c0_g1_i1.p1 TRINITY_DN9742_c0_g1~~TRINITY_DN9742_c0_g1_i1.p1  ORF type:complete len:512 (-),score=117.09 TRINITY_DN9742_c0_g1_i1:334-1869(-)